MAAPSIRAAPQGADGIMGETGLAVDGVGNGPGDLTDGSRLRASDDPDVCKPSATQHPFAKLDLEGSSKASIRLTLACDVRPAS